MPDHFVYIVRCVDGTLYTGYTTDPDSRVKMHNEGRGAKYTRGRTPVTLQYLQMKKRKGEALARELQIKRMSREAKLALCREANRSSR